MRPISRRALRWMGIGWAALVLACALPGVGRYGLTWDEPTYFRFARLQRAWLGQVATQPAAWDELFSRATIDRVWLQHAVDNGHPPLHEVWQAIGGLPFVLAGAHDTIAFRSANVLLLALTAFLLFHLVTPRLGALAGSAALLGYLGVPAIWAHGHLGATETMQNLAWVSCAILLPRLLQARHDSVFRRGLILWALVVALAFLSKFTNLLAPAWALSAAALGGAWRSRRFWIAAGVVAIAAPVGLLLFDPFFWPWLGGWPHFLDYLRQTTTRGEWMPINVYYLGRGWGFHPPWHYRPVELLVSLSAPLLVLAAAGLFFALRTSIRRATDAWRPPAVAQDGDDTWIERLALAGLALTLVVGWLPSTPNHDGTRQFVYAFLPLSLLAACIARLSRRAGLGALAFASTAFVLSLRAEPNGLSYHGPIVGGTKGAWEKGLEVTYWGDAVNGPLLGAIAGATNAADPSRPPVVYTIPKLDAMRDAEDFWQPLAPRSGTSSSRDRLGTDAVPAYWDPRVSEADKQRLGPELRMSFAERPNLLVVFSRRSTLGAPFLDLLDDLVRAGDLTVLAENLESGVPLARVYRFERMELRAWPLEQPLTLWQPTSLASLRR